MTTPNFKPLQLWMRIVGSFYIFLFVASAILHLPIRSLAPADTLDKASAGDPLARFVVDSWVILGLALCSVGIGLLLASRAPARARALVLTVIILELLWGICSDIYQWMRGHSIAIVGIWIAIHLVVITTGIRALRGTHSAE